MYVADGKFCFPGIQTIHNVSATLSIAFMFTYIVIRYALTNVGVFHASFLVTKEFYISITVSTTCIKSWHISFAQSEKGGSTVWEHILGYFRLF